jgi:hypothetical protein
MHLQNVFVATCQWTNTNKLRPLTRTNQLSSPCNVKLAMMSIEGTQVVHWTALKLPLQNDATKLLVITDICNLKRFKESMQNAE